MKKNIESLIILAMKEMKANGIPVVSLEPCGDGGADFVFSRGLTPEQHSKAKEIANKYIQTEWTFHKA